MLEFNISAAYLRFNCGVFSYVCTPLSGKIISHVEVSLWNIMIKLISLLLS